MKPAADIPMAGGGIKMRTHRLKTKIQEIDIVKKTTCPIATIPQEIREV